MEVVVGCNFSCEALWGGRTQVTPRIDEAFTQVSAKPLTTDWPTPPETVRSLTLSAEPLWMQEIGAMQFLPPVVMNNRQEKLLSAVGSLMLGPHCYLFAGEITHCDHYELISKNNPEARDRWGVAIILDCGIPLNLHFYASGTQSVPGFSPKKKVRGPDTFGKDAEPGMWLAGVARLHHNTFLSGLHQPVLGIVRRMQLLGMEPLQENFGQLHDVPYGTRSKLDPFLFSQDYAFMTLDIQDIGKMAYKPIPARDPACPEPEIP